MQTQIMRPVVYDYRSPSEFLRAMMDYQKAVNPRFSIRQSLSRVQGCSPGLVSQVVAGKRRLTRDQLPAFVQIFKLTSAETEYLDQRLTGDRVLAQREAIAGTAPPRVREPRAPRNHLLQNWLNVYVKDTVNLKGFKPEAATVHRLLGGIADYPRIQRSISFLLREGFWRVTEKKKIVPDDPAVVTTQGVPSGKIKVFHKQALKIAQAGLDRYPPGRRKASTVLISVNRESLEEVKTLVQKFQQELLELIEKNPEGDEQLYQVTLHLTPLGGAHEE